MINDKNIIWNKCVNCGMLQHATHVRCLKCKNDTFEKIEAEGSCELLTYTILKAPPAEFRDKTTYALGVVEFENGVKALGVINSDKVKLGMKLQAGWEPVRVIGGQKVYGLSFSKA